MKKKLAIINRDARYIRLIFNAFSALRSHGKSATFRQHYYPEGNWGWVIAACCFLANVFTTGLQLSFGVLQVRLILPCEI